MKTTIVPAQVTTVEDKIAGNIGMSQLLLLVVPIFIGSALFVLLPPFFSYATYKAVVIAVIALVCALLAIRIKGKLALFWIAVMVRYNRRPRYYVFDKNDLHLRETDSLPDPEASIEIDQRDYESRAVSPALRLSDVVTAEELMANPRAQFRLEINKKGILSVHITEVS